MSSKTKIIVLHMKEVVYTAVFLLLAIILGIVLFFMFGPGQKKTLVEMPLQTRCLHFLHRTQRQYLRSGSNRNL